MEGRANDSTFTEKFCLQFQTHKIREGDVIGELYDEKYLARQIEVY